MKIESKTVHWGDRRKTGDFTPVTTPIYTAASYVYESMEQLDRVFALEESGPSYARYDNPTRSALEELVRELEGGAGAIACASGMIAIHTALLAALMDRRKHVVAANMMYGATTSMLMNIFGPMGVETDQVDICDLAAFEAGTLDEVKTGAADHGDHLESAAAGGGHGCNRRDVPCRGRTADRGQYLRYAAAGQAAGTGRQHRLPQRDQISRGARRRARREAIIAADQAHFDAIRTLSRTIGPVTMGPSRTVI